MLRNLLAKVGALALRRPVLLLLGVCAPFGLFALASLRVPLDLSFTGIMDRSNPEVERYFETTRRYRLGGRLLLLLEGPEQLLDATARDLVPVLEAQESVRQVLETAPSDWLEQNLPWIVERPTFDAWLRLVTDPTDEQSARRLRARLEELQRRLTRDRVEGVRVMEIRLRRDPLDVDLGGTTFFEVEAAAREHLRASPVSASFSGLPALAAQDQARTLGLVRRLSPVSLLGVLLLFHFIERRWLNLASAVVPLGLAIGSTLGIVGLLLGRLTVMETFFGVTIFGLGIDFAIHLIVRQREERATGRDFDDALIRNLQGTGRGVVAGAVTTAGAFLIVAVAPDPVALHLGLSGGIGLLVCLLLMLTLMPAFWVLLETWRGHHHPTHRSATSALPMPVVPALAAHAVRRPGLHLMLALVVVLLALGGTPRLKVETNLEQVFNREVPALETTRRIQGLFGLNGAPWVMGVESLAEARRVSEALAAVPSFARAESIAQLLPADLAERRSALQSVLPSIPARLAMAETLAPLADDARRNEIALYGEALRRLQSAARRGPPQPGDLPAALRSKLVAPNGDYLVYAYAERSILDGREARRQRLAAQAIHPGATGLGALLEAIMATERPWLRWVVLGISLFVALVLIVDLRDLRLALLALVPVAVGVGVTFGALCWLGVSFSVMTSLVVPLIIGLGVDDGIHVVHRIKERVDPSIDGATAAVGRAIVMTTATTCTSFAVLLLTDHPGLESMGLVMVLGLPLCLLASITTLPALATILLPPMTPPTGPGGGTA